jgi:hypothetical protein
MPVTGAWYAVLQAARVCGRGGREFDSFTLARAAGLAPHVASAYLGLFTNWGYVRRVAPLFGRRRHYTLTRWGLRFRPKSR